MTIHALTLDNRLLTLTNIAAYRRSIFSPMAYKMMPEKGAAYWIKNIKSIW